ncbi:flavodoxin [Pectinatus sottacetonis]|uniref:flavodoxin n=1 Tax=Pectinatus sottacetonis TaxID=1002795 RepID=UPI0018C7682C|nr:flavodoxin [Pectinatus sottacetonis]
MEKTAVIYWSGTGNTEQMAKAIAEGISDAGNNCEIFEISNFSSERIKEFPKIAFGCPAMGAEELEPSEFEPVFTTLEPFLKNKKIALFGSYDWGDGEWMRLWQERIKDDHALLFDNKGLIVHSSPDDNDINACKIFGTLFSQY